MVRVCLKRRGGQRAEGETVSAKNGGKTSLLYIKINVCMQIRQRGKLVHVLEDLCRCLRGQKVNSTTVSWPELLPKMCETQDSVHSASMFFLFELRVCVFANK